MKFQNSHFIYKIVFLYLIFFQTVAADLQAILVKNINTTRVSNGSSNSDHTVVIMNGFKYFSANDRINGSELWKSDGTATGTTLVKDISPGSMGSHPYYLTVVNNTLFFVASASNHLGKELWISDGTATGTRVVKKIPYRAVSLTDSGSPKRLINVNGNLMFIANGSELWKSDGTNEGTILVKKLATTENSNFTVVNDILFFTSNDGVHGSELWKSDGSIEGTTLIKDIFTGTESSNPKSLKNVNGKLFFSADDGHTGLELWQSDGTFSGTNLVKDVLQNGRSDPSNFTNVNGVLFFLAENHMALRELWKSDGTSEGTVLVKGIDDDIQWMSDFTDINGTLFFTNHDHNPNLEYQLWKSDGTTAGTLLVKGFEGRVSDLVNINNTLFFTAEDGVYGSGFWKSDGSETGTVIVKDILSGGSIIRDGSSGHFIDKYFFFADDGIHGVEPWISDGTELGTELVKDIFFEEDSIIPYYTNMNGSLYFFVSDGMQGFELWQSDGIQQNTSLVNNFNTVKVPNPLTNVNGTLFFDHNDGVHGDEIWKFDGMETMLLKDIFYSFTGSRYHYSGETFGEMINFNNELYFAANDGVHGYELWKSGGSQESTSLVKDIVLGTEDSLPTNLKEMDGTLFFYANRGLWRSDGTEAGTSLVKKLLSDQNYNLGKLKFAVADNILYFIINDGEFKSELWRSDGSEIGTFLLKDDFITAHVSGNYGPRNLTAVNSTLFFVVTNRMNNITELWKSDGTVLGTTLLLQQTPSYRDEIADLTHFNGMLFFTASDQESNLSSLWKSDGTEIGTTQVKDVLLDRIIGVSEGKLFFNAYDDLHGIELWQSDGTNEGTLRISDIRQGPGSSGIEKIIDVDGNLFFTADDGIHGRELWVINNISDPSEEKCMLDIDKNANADPLSDGILIIRYMFGFSGDSLINNTIADDCFNCTATQLESVLEQCSITNIYDIDDNGETNALTDGLLIIRYLFGFRGDALVTNTVQNNCNRCTAPEIETYIQRLIPNN